MNHWHPFKSALYTYFSKFCRFLHCNAILAAWQQFIAVTQIYFAALHLDWRVYGRRWGANFIGRSMAFMLLLLLSPWLLLRMWWAYWHVGQIWRAQTMLGYQRRPLQRWQFADQNRGQHVPQLLNLITGELGWFGPRPFHHTENPLITVDGLKRFTVVPGLFSLHYWYELTKKDYCSEWHNDMRQIHQLSLVSNTLLFLRTLRAIVSTRRYIHYNTPSRYILLDIPLDNVTMEEALDFICQRVAERKSCQIAFVNADCANIAFHNAEYRTLLQQLPRVFIDGVGMRMASRWLRVHVRDNVNGTDLFPKLCERLADSGDSIFLLGSKVGIAAKAAAKMQAHFPNLTIAGTQHGYFNHHSAEETEQVIANINQSGANVLLVGFGVPRQDLWIQHHRDTLRPTVCAGVGGLFDYYSDRIPRAPQWMRNRGLEWVWRLLQEPGRMWRRYIVGNPVFLWRAWHDVRQQQQIHWAHRQGRWRYGFLGMLQRSWQQLQPYWHSIWVYTAPPIDEFVKRLLDVSASGLGLLLLSPFLLLIMLAIRLDSPGGPFFHQLRVGKKGHLFRMWKFRSMCNDAERRKGDLMDKNESEDGVLFKMKRDPRITRVGAFLRKFSIDELPQLWNVFVGDMSLVGPRPPLPNEVRLYTMHQRKRLDINPGITCIWQVSGRSEIPFRQQVEMDLEYITKQSFFKDMTLLVLTVPAVIKARGAY